MSAFIASQNDIKEAALPTHCYIYVGLCILLGHEYAFILLYSTFLVLLRARTRYTQPYTTALCSIILAAFCSLPQLPVIPLNFPYHFKNKENIKLPCV